MKNLSKKIIKIFWYITFGLLTTIIEGIIGSLCFITVIGIPLAKKHFNYIKLVFSFENKSVACKYSRNIKMNTLYGIFGGFIANGIYYLLGIILTISIIGYPLAKIFYKIVKYNCCPFESEIVNEQEYSSKKDTSHDISLLTKRILSDKEKLITVKKQNVNVIDYINNFIRKEDSKQNTNSYAAMYRKFYKMRNITSFAPFIAILLGFYIYSISEQYIIALILVLISLFLTVFVDNYYITKLNNMFYERFYFLFDEFKEKNEKDLKSKNIMYCHTMYFKGLE